MQSDPQMPLFLSATCAEQSEKPWVVFIVDDSGSPCVPCCTAVLGQMGFTVHEANSGEGVLELLKMPNTAGCHLA